VPNLVHKITLTHFCCIITCVIIIIIIIIIVISGFIVPLLWMYCFFLILHFTFVQKQFYVFETCCAL